MSKVLKSTPSYNRKKRTSAKRQDILNGQFQGLDGPINSQHLLISMLLPPAVQAFMKELEEEVETLCGQRHQRGIAKPLSPRVRDWSCFHRR